MFDDKDKDNDIIILDELFLISNDKKLNYKPYKKRKGLIIEVLQDNSFIKNIKKSVMKKMIKKVNFNIKNETVLKLDEMKKNGYMRSKAVMIDLAVELLYKKYLKEKTD